MQAKKSVLWQGAGRRQAAWQAEATSEKKDGGWASPSII
jgi:hypothetical protein